MNFQQTLLVALGGAVGTTLRYGAVSWIVPLLGSGAGTLFVNLVGSFAIGWVHEFGSSRWPSPWVSVLTIGLLGGFTTFSAFSWEAIDFLREGRWLLAAFYMTSMVLLGLSACFAGIWVSRIF